MTTETTMPPATTAEAKSGGGVVLQRFVRGHLSATLYNGDCCEMLPIQCDAVVTDPPYGIKRFEKGFGTTRFKGYGAETNGLQWDKTPTADELAMLLTLGTVRVIWGANNMVLPPSQCFFVWYKMQTVDNFADAELAWCDAEGVTAKVYPYAIHKHNQTEKMHPTQKPVPLMAWCMEKARIPEGATVLDPYMGSGTTGIACMRTGRNFIGIERDVEYYKLACDRFAHELDGVLL